MSEEARPEERRGPIWVFVDDDQACKIGAEWMQRLGLLDWSIKIKISPPDEMPKDAVGYCDYQNIVKGALIQLLDHRFYSTGCVLRHCMEKTLVHELLHCKFGHLYTNDDGYNQELHILLEDLARAMIFARYDLTLRDLQNRED